MPRPPSRQRGSPRWRRTRKPITATTGDPLTRLANGMAQFETYLIRSVIGLILLCDELATTIAYAAIRYSAQALADRQGCNGFSATPVVGFPQDFNANRPKIDLCSFLIILTRLTFPNPAAKLPPTTPIRLWGSLGCQAERAADNAVDPCEPDLGNASVGTVAMSARMPPNRLPRRQGWAVYLLGRIPQ